MRKIEFCNGINSSALGFGCASVLGSINAKKSRHSIECALDLGITHFDVARSYGYGEAESFVGKILRSKRHQLVIASKFGIKANRKARILAPAKPLIRFLKDKKRESTQIDRTEEPGKKSPMADFLHDRVELSVKEMQASLEQSLRSLRTDYLDFLFIHEPTASIIQIDDILEQADKLKQQGKIRAFGLSYSRDQESLHTNYLDYFDVLQFNTWSGMEYEKLTTEQKMKPTILFSPFRGSLKGMPPTERLAQVFTEFPNSVVLCTMFNEEHIKQNATLAC